MWASSFLPALKLLGWITQPGKQITEPSEVFTIQSSYHGPIADGGYAWKHAFERAEEAVKQMTLEEKVNLTTAYQGPCQANSGGVPRLNITGSCYSDGPAGPRYTDFTSQYPSAVTIAASFDTDLVHRKAVLMGREFRGKGIGVVLGPITGGPLGRSPFSGRNWEGFTPDPYLSAKLSYLTVSGIQSAGVATSLKHYILYEQEPICTGELDDEGGRTDCTQVSADIGDKVLHELYLPSFAEGVRAGAGSVMCSYNKINGTQSCENSDTMNRILKDELGFQGFVLSDFGATHSTVESANSGMDMELPGEYFYGGRLKEAVKKGDVSMTRLDDMARRILTPYYALGKDKGFPSPNYHKFNFQNIWEQDGHVFRNEHVNVQAKGTADFIRKAAADSTVLLKNEGQILPLHKKRRIGVFGSDAAYPPQGLTSCGPDLFCLDGTKKRHWNGTVTIGGGSGAAYAPYISAPLEAISIRARSHGAQVDFNLHDGIDQTNIPAITATAAQSDVCLIFVSLFLVEGWDRDHLRLDRQGEKLILLVAEHCEGEVVVVIHAGSQVLVEEWIDHPKVAGVLYAFYPGQETGNAIADVIFGDANPSAKMPFTIGHQASDYPPETLLRKPEASPSASFPEGLAIDYKWFEKTSVSPRFGFGFGLSYTTFKYSDISLSKHHRAMNDSIQQTNERFLGHGSLYDVVAQASVNVTNTGKVAGADVVQLYMRFPTSEKDQPRHLRGFTKPFLHPKQSKKVVFEIRAKDVSIWDVERQAWRIPNGQYHFDVARSSNLDDVELRGSVSF